MTSLAEADVATRAERKLLWHVASLVFLLYFSFAIDSGNIGFAALQMNTALGLSAEVFGLGSGLFTLAYLLFQAPNAEMLRRLGVRRGFALVACAWGLVSSSTAFVPQPISASARTTQSTPCVYWPPFSRMPGK